jgi:cytochrome c oxidase subunit IV
VLVLATVVTFWLGTRHPFSATSVGLAASIAIAIGIGKAAFIGLEFMELRHAPPGLRYAFLAWCAAGGRRMPVASRSVTGGACLGRVEVSRVARLVDRDLRHDRLAEVVGESGPIERHRAVA